MQAVEVDHKECIAPLRSNLSFTNNTSIKFSKHLQQNFHNPHNNNWRDAMFKTVDLSQQQIPALYCMQLKILE